MIVIPDAGPLIYLAGAGQLELLTRLYVKVVVPRVVYEEVTIAGEGLTGSAEDGARRAGYDMTKTAAQKVYEAAGIGPDDVDVVELHDCFTANEVLTYEGLGLSPRAAPRSSSGTRTGATDGDGHRAPEGALGVLRAPASARDERVE